MSIIRNHAFAISKININGAVEVGVIARVSLTADSF
jgi:hypothetical protein